ncbi:hypothetical protein BDM02DRAFT_3182405 [Thelephora ganbajun]|uniref:Uncharacterized protein n=1 Tax=Thelephora ganbajun TaxID=370292 RepID=A0ACB6ZXD8_THEGA|nr:hypothetical protein BDM02DRAFT_3182405 [Thelephora ganbajun]
MPSPSDPDTVPVVSLNDWDENVWASSSSSSHHHNFTSSLKNIPPSPTRPSRSLYRRRTSENASTTSRPKIPWDIQHSRAESSDSVRAHPLRRDSVCFSSSAFNDPTVTRPILNLWLSPGQTVDVNKNPFEVEDEVKACSGEKEELVLVHEVTTTDSLQGVSLKYGISMADLRKANQMWPSDSIHLRRSLNVPVNKASKLKQLSVDGPMEPQRTSPSSSTVSLATIPDIRWIPASHLSFFPQGSPSISPVDTVVTDAQHPYIPGRFSSSGSGLSPIPPSSNSSSIFSTLPRAFPIAKDVIMSRLSLDSVGTPPKEEQEHEMGVVGRNSGVNGIRPDDSRQRRDVGTDSRTTSRTSGQAQGLRDRRETRPRNYDAYRIGEGRRERASTVIRTSQLEPSPEMLVPVLGQKRAKGEQEFGL